MAKLAKEIPADVPVREMKDGDVAVITKWAELDYSGRIVQRAGDVIIYIGTACGEHNHTFNIVSAYDDCRVRILPKGTLIEL